MSLRLRLTKATHRLTAPRHHPKSILMKPRLEYRPYMEKVSHILSGTQVQGDGQRYFCDGILLRRSLEALIHGVPSARGCYRSMIAPKHNGSKVSRDTIEIGWLSRSTYLAFSSKLGYEKGYTRERESELGKFYFIEEEGNELTQGRGESVHREVMVDSKGKRFYMCPSWGVNQEIERHNLPSQTITFQEVVRWGGFEVWWHRGRVLRLEMWYRCGYRIGLVEWLEPRDRYINLVMSLCTIWDKR